MICPTVSKHPATRLLFSHLLFSHVDSPTDIRGGCASYPTSSSVHKFRHVCLQIMSVFVPLGPRGKKKLHQFLHVMGSVPHYLPIRIEGELPRFANFRGCRMQCFFGDICGEDAKFRVVIVMRREVGSRSELRLIFITVPERMFAESYTVCLKCTVCVLKIWARTLFITCMIILKTYCPKAQGDPK